MPHVLTAKLGKRNLFLSKLSVTLFVPQANFRRLVPNTATIVLPGDTDRREHQSPQTRAQGRVGRESTQMAQLLRARSALLESIVRKNPTMLAKIVWLVVSARSFLLLAAINVKSALKEDIAVSRASMMRASAHSVSQEQATHGRVLET